MTDQPVEIHPYDPAWRQRFDEQRAALTTLLAPWLAAALEHVGSTAVPGLAAKPVVDILAPVTSLAAARAAIIPLHEAGWWYWPDDPDRAHRLWFLRPRPDARTHHLHVIEAGDPHAAAVLAFRDALRADPALRAGYADLKRRLAREHPHNRNAYTNGKAEFVAQVVRAAGVDLPPRDPLPA